MTPNDIIVDVKRLAQDSGLLRSPDSYRDATLLAFVNQTIRRMVVLRPDLFSILASIPTVPNQVVQAMPSDSFRLIEIFQVTGGPAVEEVDRDRLNRTDKSWTEDAAGVPTRYMRHPRSPNRYFLSPKPQAGIELLAEYVKVQPTYGLSQTIVSLPDDYQPMLVDGTLYAVASINNEENMTQFGQARANALLQSFVQGIGASIQARTLSDIETAGLVEQ